MDSSSKGDPEMPNREIYGIRPLLLASVALLLAGCARTSAPPPVELPQVVLVAVDYDAATGKAIVTPKSIRLKEGKQFVRWMSCDGTIDPRFNLKDTPFEHPPMPAKVEAPAPGMHGAEAAARAAAPKHQVDSEKPKPGSARVNPYLYEVYLTVPGTAEPIKADPMIFVDP
jgi:hypothetical protein